MTKAVKFIKEWGLTLVLVVVLLVPSWRLTLSSWLQGIILQTGLCQPKTEATGDVLSPIDYQVVLEAVNGSQFNLSQWQGQTLFINFWATWCAPCLAEMSDLDALYQDLRDQPNLKFAFISTDDDWSKAQTFVQRKGYVMPIYRVIGPITPALRTGTLPTTLVVDSSGEVVVKHQGMAQYYREDFIEFLKTTAASE